MKRALVGLAVLALAAALLVSPPRPTLASWADTEKATGSFAAYTVPKPTITSCSSSNVLGSGNITIKWKYNSTSPTPTSTFWFSSSSLITLVLLPGSTTTTGPIAGEYTTSFSSGLLTGLLGGPAYVGVAANQYGWGSQIAGATATLPAVIGSGTCVIAP
jgi:hypothetical protein